MLAISIKVSGSQQTRDKLRRVGTSLYDLTFAMQDIGKNAAKYYANQGMNSQGGVFGAQWTPLKKRTIAQKAKKWGNTTPLVASGAMRDSFTYTASSRSVLIGNKAPYFKYHQSTLPRNKLPRRQMMGINDPIRQIIQKTINAEVKRKIRAA